MPTNLSDRDIADLLIEHKVVPEDLVVHQAGSLLKRRLPMFRKILKIGFGPPYTDNARR